MSYKELKSFSFGDEAIYVQEYTNRFNSPESVKINFYINDRQAFFLQNSEVMTLAYHIAKLDKQICTICNTLPGVAINQYSKKCLIDEIVITNKIEGVRSSRKEIGEALVILETQSKSKGKHQRFLGLVNKYLKLIKQEPLPLNTCDDVRNIYNEVFLEEVISENPNNKPDGKIFRKNSVSVYDETDKIIHTGVSPENKIIEVMQSSLQFLNDSSIDELFRSCIFHYLIEYIHPFYDGNGRLGRFILSYGIANALSPLISFRISKVIKENINTYYKAFKMCNDHRNLGDITPFLIMLLNMIFNAMCELKPALEEKHATWGRYENLVKKYYSPDEKLHELYSLLIQAALFSEKGITSQELQNHMDLSDYMIKKLMNKIPKELIMVQTKSNFKFYSINLKVLDDIVIEQNIDMI